MRGVDRCRYQRSRPPIQGVPAAPDVLAFRVPVDQLEMAELRFFGYRTHSECLPTHYDRATQRPIGMRPQACPGCIDNRRDHDPGDEDDGLRRLLLWWLR